jgi:lysophospholipase L1-like esterase
MRKVSKIFSILSTSVLVGALFCSSAFAKGEDKEHKEGKETLVSLGDSITFGYNLGVNNDHPSKLAFPSIIGEDEDLKTNNLGVPGWTTSDLLNAFTDSKFVKEVRRADLITLDIGNNDLLNAAAPILEKIKMDPTYVITPTDQNNVMSAIQGISKNLPAIISKIRQETSASIVIYTMYNPFLTGTSLHSFGELFIPTANQLIKGIATQSNNLVADAYSAFTNHELEYIRVQQQDIHPTIEGQIVLAGLAEKVIPHDSDHKEKH